MDRIINSIDRTATVANVTREMRNRIILHQFPAGSAVTEEALSAEFGTSRGTVRTAMQALEKEGLIATFPNGRKQIVGITEKFVCDLFATRALLECEAVRLVLARAGYLYSNLAEAVNTFSDIESESDEEVLSLRVVNNERFHSILVEMSNSRPLIQCWRTIEPLITAFVTFNSVSLGIQSHRDLYITPHKRILDMLVAKDPAVVEYMAYHTKVAAREETIQGLKLRNLL